MYKNFLKKAISLSLCFSIFIFINLLDPKYAYAVTQSGIGDTTYIGWNNLTDKNINLMHSHFYQITPHTVNSVIAHNASIGMSSQNPQNYLVPEQSTVALDEYYYQPGNWWYDDGGDLYYAIDASDQFHIHLWDGYDGSGLMQFMLSQATYFITSLMGIFTGAGPAIAYGKLTNGMWNNLAIQSAEGLASGSENVYVNIDGAGVNSQVNILNDRPTITTALINNKYVVIFVDEVNGGDKLNFMSDNDAFGILTVMTVQQYNIMQFEFQNAINVATSNNGSAVLASMQQLLPTIPAVSMTYPLPDGSYQQTCKNIQFDNIFGVLVADCNNTQNQAVASVLTLNTQCNLNSLGDIENMAGKLQCVNTNIGNTVPSGSYQQSCVNYSMNSSGTVSAKCTNQAGVKVNTSLDYGACSLDDTLSNQNGLLSCD